ncbi:hypothetical protein Tco_0866070 [Tanacetum coccineum]
MMSHIQSTHARRTYAPQHKVLTNDDLLTQILIRLPILSIYLFTTVSKQWLRILTSPDFTRNHRQIRNIDPPAGLFVNHITSSFHYVFVSLDTRIKSTKYTSDKSFTLGYTEAVVNVNILQSCNESGNWTLCRERFTYFLFVHFDSAIYWNDALHWLETENRRLTHYKLNIEDHEHPIITTIQISQDHEQPIITTMLPMIISIRIPHMLHLEGKLFESLGCLVLVRRDCIGSSKFTIYQMRKGCSVWSSKYIVNTDDFMNPLPEGWSIRSIVWSIVLGEREEDSFIIINLSAKVVQYNLILKTLREIYDMRSNEISDDYLHGFIPPYAMYDVGYKKLDYKVDYILVMMSEEPNTNAQETYAPPHKVLTKDDLLSEIFIRLLILCIHLFTCVLKQWLKILKSPAFTLKHSQIRCLDSPAGLFVNHIRSSFDCDFVSLNPRINLRKYTIENSFTLGSIEEADKVKILQSCNGLLLCTGSRRHAFDYVYNLSTNLLKILLEPDYANVDSNVYGCAGLRLAFDPIKSRYYKVVRTGRICSDIFIQIYSLEKGNWSLYHVDTNDFMTPLHEGWSIWSTLWSIVLGEKEDDSFLVINLSGKVVEYNLISKNLQEMYDIGSNQLTDDYHDGFISTFTLYDMRPKQVDHKVYKFIPSYASV